MTESKLLRLSFRVETNLANAQHCLLVAAVALHVPKNPRMKSIVAMMPVAALLPVEA